MENKERGMAPNPPEIPDIKEPSHDSHRLTIMVMRSVGQIRSFKVSSKLIIGTAIFFVLYMVVSIYIINDYTALRRKSRNYSDRINVLKTQEWKARKGHQRLKERIVLLEDYIKTLEKRKKTPPQKEMMKKERVVIKRNEDVIVERPVERESAFEKPLTIEAAPKEQAADLVDVKEMVIQKEGAAMVVNFKLVNLQPGEMAVKGYIHILGKGKSEEFPEEWTYPKQELQNGMPLNYKRGQFFLIQRFKPIRGKFMLHRGKEAPSVVKVLVYDRSGTTILEKEFEVENVS
ncbi:MAG: hypothetical protein JRJ85_02235 [Deltaproteobacteria bacterium]|nr:hypothetical protein [Deltaproteobacteria bacterium]